MKRGIVLKRVFDAAFAGTLLILLFPLMLLVAAAISINMGRPVIFRQERAGFRKKPFTIYKFRTMSKAVGNTGELLPDRERLTRLGRFLRRTSLDELPQLWNVLKGELSLVGPRPLPMRYLPYYTAKESLRFAVLPGITGWAQIHGRNEASWSDRFARDVWYVEHWSFGLDLYILAITLAKVFRSEGVVVEVSSAMLNLDEERQRIKPADRS